MGFRLSVITPTYNERANIDRFVECVFAALQGHDFELIVVDDDSPDRTWERVAYLRQNRPQLRLLRRSKRPSLSGAVIDGFRAATGEVIAVLDADLQHNPHLLPLMLRKMVEADLVVASRYTKGGSTSEWNPIRRLISRLGIQLCRVLLGLPLSDPLSGYFMMRKPDFKRITRRLNGNGFKILIEIASAMPRAKVAEVPLQFGRRTAGRSRFNVGIAFAYLRQLMRLRQKINEATPVTDAQLGRAA